MTPPRRRRHGFTLIELLVVISIIAILMGLLLPALSGAREAGRRTQTMNNIRNVGLGLMQYVNAKQVFPNNGTFGPTSAPTTSVGTIVLALSATGTDQPTPNRAGEGALYSWVVDILPYIDQVDTANKWNKKVAYNSGTTTSTNPESNFSLMNTGIGVLTSTNDDTTLPGKGNLSFVVNGGFSFWPVNVHAPSSLATTANSGVYDQAQNLLNAEPMNWVVGGDGSQDQSSILIRTGVFFPGTIQGNIAGVDSRTRLSSITDGAATTLMLAENVFAGTGDTAGDAASWASPQPHFNTFYGSSAVCDRTSSPFDCTVLAYLPLGSSGPYQGDAPGWANANNRTSNPFESINGGVINGLTNEGRLPFPNSRHVGGVCVAMCDGSIKFIPETVDGTVWAKAITPQGGKLPYVGGAGSRQGPLSADALSD